MRAWFFASLFAISGISFIEPEQLRRPQRVHDHERLLAVHRQAGHAGSGRGPEPAQRRGRQHAQVVHHAHDLVGGEGILAAQCDPEGLAPPGQTRHHRVVDPPENPAAAQEQVAMAWGGIAHSRPKASRFSTRTTRPATGASPSRKPPPPATTAEDGTSATSRAASTASPMISRASVGPAQTTMVTG